MANDQVPVFWQDQDIYLGPPADLWTRTECRAQRKVLGEFIDSGKKFRLYAYAPKVSVASAARLRPSNFVEKGSAITVSETLASVGIAGEVSGRSEGTIPAPENIVRNAQAKVREYLKIHDDKAALAIGRWKVHNSSEVL